MSKKNNTVKKCAIDSLKNEFDILYSKYKFLYRIDDYLWEFAENDFEAFACNFLFFLKSLDSDFIDISNEFSKLLGD